MSVGSSSALIERGYWIQNCYGNLNLPKPTRPPRATLSLATPPPKRIVQLDRDSLTLEVTAGRSGEFRLEINVLDTFEFSAPRSRHAGQATSFQIQDVPERLLTVRAVYPGPKGGLYMG